MKRSTRLRRLAWISAFTLVAIASASSQGIGSASDLKAAAFVDTRGRPSPAPDCGATIYKDAGTPWKCTFADEFSGRSLDSSKWMAQTTASNGFHTGVDCVVDSSNNIAVANGTVRLTVRKEKSPFTCKSPYGDFTTQYTAGGIMTWGRFAQTYGRFEFRVKFPDTKVAGVQTALWMYPTEHNYGAWPASGEIDVAEYYSVYPDRAIPYLHYNTDSTIASGVSEVTNWGCTMDNPSAFHTYVAEWTVTGIKISFDGNVCTDHAWNPSAPLTAPQPFDKPFAIIMSQVLGVGNNAPTDSTPLPATTEVDWVHVWS